MKDAICKACKFFPSCTFEGLEIELCDNFESCAKEEQRFTCPCCRIDLIDNAWEQYPQIDDNGVLRCASCDHVIPCFLALKVCPDYLARRKAVKAVKALMS